MSYDLKNGSFKLAAAWLIDQAGFKGLKKGNVAVHENQALILTNLGHASGKELLLFSEEIQRKIDELFGVELEREVNII